MPTLAELLRHACATETRLRCAARVNLHKYSIGTLSLIAYLFDEGRPSGIRDGLSEHPARHSFDVQIFDDDQTIAKHHPSRNLVVKISALMADMRVRLLQKQHSLAPTVRTFLSSGDFTLRASQFGLCLSVMTRVLNLRPVRESGERCESDIHADRFATLRQSLCFAFDAETGVPTSRLAFDRDSLDSPFKRTVQLDLEQSDALQPQFGINQFAAVAITGKRETVEARRTFEAGKPAFTPRFTRLKKALNVLSTLRRTS